MKLRANFPIFFYLYQRVWSLSCLFVCLHICSVCECACIYVCMHVHVYVYVHDLWLCLCTHAVHVDFRMCMYIRRYASVHIYVVCSHSCIYVHMHKEVYICTCIHVCMFVCAKYREVFTYMNQKLLKQIKN